MLSIVIYKDYNVMIDQHFQLELLFHNSSNVLNQKLSTLSFQGKIFYLYYDEKEMIYYYNSSNRVFFSNISSHFLNLIKRFANKIILSLESTDF